MMMNTQQALESLRVDGKVFLSTSENTYIRKGKEDFHLILEGKNGLSIGLNVELNTAVKEIEQDLNGLGVAIEWQRRQEYQKGTTVGTWWNLNGTSCTLVNDSSHTFYLSGTVSSAKFSQERQTFVYNVITTTGFFLAEEENLSRFK